MSPKDQVETNFSVNLLPRARLFHFLYFKVVRMNESDKGLNDGEEATAGCCSGLLIAFSIILIVFTFPFSIFFCIRIIPEYERAIIFRLGRLKKVKSQILSNFSHGFADTREALSVPACSSSSPALMKSK